PERPIAVATIASQQAITASPVSAATAALITVLAGHEVNGHAIGLGQIMMICIPSTLLGVIVAALVQTRIGKELDQDPEYLRRVAAGQVEGPEQPAGAVQTAHSEPALPKRAGLSAGMFLVGVALVVLL